VSALPGPAHGIRFADAARVWARVAALSFGGPAGQIAVMHRILVEEKRWVGDRRFLQALNFCMLLPGPEAHQLTIYLGWLLHGIRGGLVAGALFVLPGFVAMMALSALYVADGGTDLREGLFCGLTAAVLASVVLAVARLGRRVLGGRPLQAIAAAAFAAIFAFDVRFPLIVVIAGMVGWLGARYGVLLDGGGGHGGSAGGVADADSLLGAGTPAHARRAFRPDGAAR
jgi:chromate transporter